MNDSQLTIAAAIVEIGFPLALLAATLANTRYRARTIVLLGSVAPLVLFYVVVSFTHLVLHRDDAGWSFYAMWEMTFGAYAFCALLGFALCLSPVPGHLAARFVLGLLAPGAVAGLIALGF